MTRIEQAENTGQISEVTPGKEGSAPADDIADTWQEEFSQELTWADLTRWLSEAG